MCSNANENGNQFLNWNTVKQHLQKKIIIIEWNRIEIEIEGDDAMGMIECAWSSKAIAWIQFYS